MGYDLHITRKNDWSDEDNIKNISLEEWIDYIEADADLVLSDAYRVKVLGSLTKSQVAPGFCDWIAHPSGENAWFAYENGSIETKDPDEDVIRKMLLIAEALGAMVQGDDGEVYSLTSDNQITTGYGATDESYSEAKNEHKKPWWRFW